MPKIAKGYPKTTADSFSCLVEGMLKGETYRFWLYYDNGPNNRTQIGDTEEYAAANNGAHTFSKDGLRAEADLMYTIAYLPAGKTDWSVTADIKYVALRSTAKTKADEPAKVWPGNWTKWANLKAGDPTTTVKASEWNDFLDHINAVIDYKGGTQFDFTNYKKVGGDEMKANDFNSGAATAMRSIGLSPPVASGIVTAQFFKDYEDQLNSAK